MASPSRAKGMKGLDMITKTIVMIMFIFVMIMTILHTIISSDITWLPVPVFWGISLALTAIYLVLTLLALMDNGLCADMFGQFDPPEEVKSSLLVRDRGSTVCVSIINTTTSMMVFLAWILYWASNMNITSSDTVGVTQYHETAYGWLNALSAGLYAVGAVSYPLVTYGAYVRFSALQAANGAAKGKLLEIDV
jgi:hypothetical protein